MKEHDSTERISPKGPFVYENWKRLLSGEVPDGAYEFPIYSDARIIGQVSEGLGPLQFLNLIASGDGHVDRPVIMVRTTVVPWVDDGNRGIITDATRYHAGDQSDEIASLVSLSLGIRAMAGNPTREFRHGEDPRGRPIGYRDSKNPIFYQKSIDSRLVIPPSPNGHSLNSMSLFETLPLLSSADATALVISARTYQNAIWIAESQPELSWLLFVSAIETAANHANSAGIEPMDNLKISKPMVFDLLIANCDRKIVEQVATEIAPSLGATSKFIKFVMKHMPDAPDIRPPEYIQVDWKSKAMKKSISKIYDHRSKALHTGRPFPYPMCMSPGRNREQGLNEVPPGLGQTAMGGSWLIEDTPMLLHTFEYITRNVLLDWWKSMVPSI